MINTTKTASTTTSPDVFHPKPPPFSMPDASFGNTNHSQPDANADASLYDIREYFQGRNDAGRMNARSGDETYTKLIADLRAKLSLLPDKITSKIYEYEFLKA